MPVFLRTCFNVQRRDDVTAYMRMERWKLSAVTRNSQPVESGGDTVSSVYPVPSSVSFYIKRSRTHSYQADSGGSTWRSIKNFSIFLISSCSCAIYMNYVIFLSSSLMSLIVPTTASSALRLELNFQVLRRFRCL